MGALDPTSFVRFLRIRDGSPRFGYCIRNQHKVMLSPLVLMGESEQKKKGRKRTLPTAKEYSIQTRQISVLNQMQVSKTRQVEHSYPILHSPFSNCVPLPFKSLQSSPDPSLSQSHQPRRLNMPSTWFWFSYLRDRDAPCS